MVSISDITLEGSCGIAEVDQLVRSYVLADFRFSPEYRDGKPVASVFPLEVPFKPFD